MSAIASRTLLVKSVFAQLVSAIASHASPLRVREALLCLACVFKEQDRFQRGGVPLPDDAKSSCDFPNDGVQHVVELPAVVEHLQAIAEAYDASVFVRCLLHTVLRCW